MTAGGKSLVERLRWHHEHPVTGKMVLVNPDGPEAAGRIEQLEQELTDCDTANGGRIIEIAELKATIGRLEREKEEAQAKRDYHSKRSYAARKAAAANHEGIEHWKSRAEAAEFELSRLKAPLPDSRTTARDRAELREILAEAEKPLEVRDKWIERLLDDLDAATAQARSAVEALEPFADFGDVLLDEASTYRVMTTKGSAEIAPYDFRRAAAIRARRKGETGNG